MTKTEKEAGKGGLEQKVEAAVDAKPAGKGKAKSFLYLGELAMATKAYDPAAMDGLALWLQLNGYGKQLSGVIIDSGLLPEAPPFYSTRNAEVMRFLGSDFKRDATDLAELGVDFKGLDESDRKYYDEHVLYKVKNLDEAVDYAKREMTKLTATLAPGTPIHYIRGEEDRRNLGYFEELEIPNWIASPKSRKQNIEQQLRDLKDTLDKMRSERKELEEQQSELRKQREGLKRGSPEYVKLTESINKAREQERHTRREIEERGHELSKVKHELQVSAPLAGVFKRKAIPPDLSEIIFRQAKNKYFSKHHEVFRHWQGFSAHASNEVVLELEGIVFNVKHSTSDKSDAPSSNAIREMGLEVNDRRNNNEPIPDVSITAHGKFGCRMQWLPKTEEPIGEGQRRPTPEQTVNIQLPTFQSPALLAKLKEKLPRNLHVKRYADGLFGTGAVVHRFYENGVQEVELVSVPELIKYGGIAGQIRDLQKKLRTGKKAGSEQDELRKKIAALEDLVRTAPSPLAKPKDAGKAILVEGYSDVHLGSLTHPGRPTPVDLAHRAMNYQRRDERLPDVLVFNGDILHGILKHTSANAQYTAKTPAELRAEEARIRTRTDLDAMTKEQAIADLYRESLGQLNVTNLAKQREEFIYTFKPYCMDVLRNGGKIVLVSGNHFNKTTKSAGGEAIDDEAYALAQLLDGYEKYKAEGKIIILDGLGEEYGIGTMPLGDGKELYAVHEPGRGSDPALALMRKLKNEDRTPHLALSGHLHVPTIGFANGRLALQYPGMQSWSKYLTLFSAKASLRGKINVEVDPRRQWARVRGIYDPTLERPEYR